MTTSNDDLTDSQSSVPLISARMNEPVGDLPSANDGLTIVARFHSPFHEKFGIPKQSGLAPDLQGTVVFEPEYRQADAIRGIEGFDYLWLLWSFSTNPHAPNSLMVRPPVLGGNTKVGVFASRSPFRPNAIGLSSVRLSAVDYRHPQGPILRVSGADLMDGTPIYDIKPYLPYTDSHPDARSGFTGPDKWPVLQVRFTEEARRQINDEEAKTLEDILKLDPRPHYKQDSGKRYGMAFAGKQIRFKVQGTCLEVFEIQPF